MSNLSFQRNAESNSKNTTRDISNECSNRVAEIIWAEIAVKKINEMVVNFRDISEVIPIENCIMKFKRDFGDKILKDFLINFL